jgi:tetratricopeptide (TPR) repeat protein
MKNIAYILLFLTQLLAAQSFDKGNALFRKGDYKGAVNEYEGILSQKKESAEVYFNLGNAYYKLNQVAPAVYNYEKALQLNPGDKDIEVNLAFAQKMALDDIKSVPKTGFSKALYGVMGNYHYNTWGWIAVFFSIAVLLLFTGYYLAGRTLLKRTFFVGMFVAVFGIVLSVIAAVFVKSQQAAENPAIIFAEVVSVKGEPETGAQDAFVLHAGTKVNVTATLEGWKKIQLADDSVGWVEKSALKELK